MKNFKALGINDNIIEGLSALGFDTPTEVQEKVIPLMLDEQVDLVSLAQTEQEKQLLLEYR